jgi:hypothetical protein
VQISRGFKFSLTMLVMEVRLLVTNDVHLLMMPGPLFMRKSVQVWPRPGKIWSTAWRSNGQQRSCYQGPTKQIWLKKLKISSSVFSLVMNSSMKFYVVSIANYLGLPMSVMMSTQMLQVRSFLTVDAREQEARQRRRSSFMLVQGRGEYCELITRRLGRKYTYTTLSCYRLNGKGHTNFNSRLYLNCFYNSSTTTGHLSPPQPFFNRPESLSNTP